MQFGLARWDENMERAWLIVSMLCLMVAAFFVWRAQANEAYWSAAFVAATLGVVAWFVRLRTQLRKTIPRHDEVPVDNSEEMEEADED